MANSAQATKRAGQDVKRRARNLVHRTRFRTFQKKVLASIARNDPVLSKQAFVEFAAVADQVTSKGIIHRNKTARLKSKLNKAVEALVRSSAS